MKIRKNHTDYYDSAVAAYADKTLFFDRKVTDITLPFHKIFGLKEENVNFANRTANEIQRFGYHPARMDDFTPYVIIFCGKVIPMVIFNNPYVYQGCKFVDDYIEHKGFNAFDKHRLSAVFFNIDEVCEFYAEFIKTNRDHLRNSRYDTLERRLKTIKLFFEDFSENPLLKTDNFHREYRSPYAIVRVKSDMLEKPMSLELNSILRNFGFGRIFDAYTCYQEIEMYMSNVIGRKESEMIDISDKDKVTGKGFDSKMSFRKAPTKRV